MANYRLKDQVLVRDLASFKWKAAWLRCVEVASHEVLVSKAFFTRFASSRWLAACLKSAASSQECVVRF